MRELLLYRVGLIACLVSVAAVLWPGPGWSADRIALVVGNSEYKPGNAPRLPNPVNDARSMAQALETSGFEVQLVTDADQAAMKKAIKEFGKQLVQAGGDTVGLFYFAGHGVEDRGQNYLIPLGAEIESEVDFHTDAVLMDWVLARMKRAGNRLNMVILDACRNNPFEGRYRGASQGLAQMGAPSGSLIAYAAAPKQVAYDGEGENSPYTAALAEALVVPGLKVEDVFKRVRVAVEEATNGEQTPWENSSLRGDFYFVAKVEEPPPPEPSPVTVSDPPATELTREQLAARAYEAAERVNTVSSYRLFVEQYPDTLYATLAEEQIGKLENAVTPPAPSPEEVEAVLGLERAERRQIQMGLASLGFDPGPADGLFGQRTREALGKWQTLQGEKRTGHLNAEAAQVLLAAGEDAARKRAAMRPGRIFRDCLECPEMVVVPAGSFMMGSPSSEEGREDDEAPQHRVTISEPLAVGKYEVTRGEFAQFVETTGHSTGATCSTFEDGGWELRPGRGWRNPGYRQDERHPVACVSWDDAKAYVRWLSRKTGERYRLLSEAEWEYAARAGSRTSRYWDDDAMAQCDHANGRDEAAKERYSGLAAAPCRDGAVYTARVGRYGENGFGLKDMLGNVSEWIEDCWHDSYAGAPSDGRAWVSGGDCGQRVLRGGSWYYPPRALRLATRSWSYTESRDWLHGFRVSRTLVP